MAGDDGLQRSNYINAILYVCRTGCPWRALPHDFAVRWSAAHKRFMAWSKDGTWDLVLSRLRAHVRQRAARKATPSAGVVDSCSVKSAPVAGGRGFDGAKKVQGVKRHIVVDTLGLLVAVVVTPADVGDRDATQALLERARRCCRRLRHIWADRGYTGQRVAATARALRFDIQIVSGPKPKGRFVLQKRRWVVERTFAWMHRYRRLNRQYETTPFAHEAMTKISQISLMLRRLDGTKAYA